MEENKSHIPPIKAMLPSEIADLYGVKPKTLTRWLKDMKSELVRKNSKYYTPLQVLRIFNFLGNPT
jgi:hypothetical protein